MRLTFTLLVFTLLNYNSLAQNEFEIATLFNYNILNYRNSTSQCNGTTNSSSDKEDGLKVLIKHTDPDIICLQEVGNNPVNLDRLLTNALNTDGETKYNYTNYAATSFSGLMNATFYNTEKFELYSQDAIETNLDNSNIVRLIDAITFYYKDPVLDQTLDTTFLTVFVAHLKAGNSTSDRNDRAKATAALMDYINNNPTIENFMLAGDLNVYSGSTADFDNLVSSNAPDRRFYDPIQQIGSWSNNASYRYTHTQSTRLSQTNGGCFSGGGMDDRFDFVLISESIKEDNARIGYINNTYKALGQDGNRFNQTINSPVNTSEPAAVIDALYEVSDHLPVVMSFTLSYSAPLGVEKIQSTHEFSAYPGVEDELIIRHKGSTDYSGTLQLFDVTGRTLMNTSVSFLLTDEIKIHLPQHKGLIIMTFTSNSGERTVIRTYKN